MKITVEPMDASTTLVGSTEGWKYRGVEVQRGGSTEQTSVLYMHAEHEHITHVT
jgi:hypothetical protein